MRMHKCINQYATYGTSAMSLGRGGWSTGEDLCRNPPGELPTLPHRVLGFAANGKKVAELEECKKYKHISW